MNTGNDYLDTAIRRMKYYKDLAEKTFAQLDDQQLHWRPNEACTSIAVNIRHMAGNMISRWTNFLTTDGEKPDRHRDHEFDEREQPRAELMALWEKGWQCFLGTLASLREPDLGRSVLIRGESLTVVDAINRQLAHQPYHVGQIVYIGKMLKGDAWQTLSIARGKSEEYNQAKGIKDPSRNFNS